MKLLSLLVWVTTLGLASLSSIGADRLRSESPGTESQTKRQTSGWGPALNGLQCRVIVPVEAEQGEEIQAVAEFRMNRETLRPQTKRLNILLPQRFLSLSLSNLQTAKEVLIHPYDPGSGMPVFDSGQVTALLDGSALASFKVSFPLLTHYQELTAGAYDCQVQFSFPTNRPQWWRGDESTWQNAGFWNGSITSGQFRLNLRPETPKMRTFSVPKRLRLVKELRNVRDDKDAPIVAIPMIRFKAADAEKIVVALRNGHFVGTRCTRKDGMSLRSEAPIPDDVNPVSGLYNYQGGDKKLDYTMEFFETADVPGHLWHPGPGSGGYRVLWTKTFSIVLNEESFRKQPAQALDLSNRRFTDAQLSILKQHPQLERLSLAENKITDRGLPALRDLKRLESLHLHNTKVTDAGLKHLKSLRRLKELHLSGTKVTDAGLGNLRALSHLGRLDLAGCTVTDAGMEHLKHLRKLTFLNLHQTQVSDAGLVHFGALTNLVWLSLSGTPLSDSGLTQLKGLVNLRTLQVGQTRVSHEGVDRLREMLPQCEIEH